MQNSIAYRQIATNGTGRKKSFGCDLEKEEKLDWSYTQRRKPSEVGDRGSDDRKKIQGEGNDKGILNEFLKESSYAELKSKADNRKEWRIWKPRTCLTAEH